MNNSLRDQYFTEKAQLFKYLSSPVKLKLLQFISFAPRTVEECAKKIEQSVQNTSLHLISLEKAGILDKWKVKNYHYYSLENEELAKLINQALELGGQSLIEDEYIYKKDMESIAQEIRDKKIILIDLRSFEERSHLSLSASIIFQDKIENLLTFIETLPSSRKHILLCKGKLCERLYSAIKVIGNSSKVKVLPYSAYELKTLAKLLSE